MHNDINAEGGGFAFDYSINMTTVLVSLMGIVYAFELMLYMIFQNFDISNSNHSNNISDHQSFSAECFINYAISLAMSCAVVSWSVLTADQLFFWKCSDSIANIWAVICASFISCLTVSPQYKRVRVNNWEDRINCLNNCYEKAMMVRRAVYVLVVDLGVSVILVSARLSSGMMANYTHIYFGYFLFEIIMFVVDG